MAETTAILKSAIGVLHLRLLKSGARWQQESQDSQQNPEKGPPTGTAIEVHGVPPKIQERKSSLNINFLGEIFLGHPGPRRRDIPDKNFMQVAFFCCFRQGVAGMSQVGTSQIWKNFMQENFGLIFRTLKNRRRAEYGFGEHGFKHRTQ